MLMIYVQVELQWSYLSTCFDVKNMAAILIPQVHRSANIKRAWLSSVSIHSG